MKRKFALLLIIFSGLIAAHAQVTFKPGIRAGANISKITQTDFDSRTDFYVGGFGAIKFTRFYTLQPEINYSRQGAGEGNFYDYNTSSSIKTDRAIELNYLSFGVINKFTFTDQFNLHFGPLLDFETSSNVRTNSDVDMAFTAGIGYTFPMGLSIEARVKKGIIDVLETDDYNNNNYFVEDYNTNFLFQLGLSYSFDVKGTTK
jgi:hypothetical protein